MSHYTRDIFAKPFTRDALDITTEVLILGGGFGGLYTAVKLEEGTYFGTHKTYFGLIFE